MDCFDALAVSASMPFRHNLNGTTLRAILLSGTVPETFWPRLNRAMTELPLVMITRLLDEYPAGPDRDAVLAGLR